MSGSQGSSSSEKIYEAIQLANAGRRQEAAAILRPIVFMEPNNELAWHWLASVAADEAEYRRALNEVLRINPNNTQARQQLANLQPPVPAPAAQPVPSYVDEGLKRKRSDELPTQTVFGNTLLFGIIGVGLFIACNCLSTAATALLAPDDPVEVAEEAKSFSTLAGLGLIAANMAIPLITGYLAGGAALRSKLARRLVDSGTYGALAAGFTAVIYATFLCLCLLVMAGTVEDRLNDLNVSLFDVASASGSVGTGAMAVCMLLLFVSVLIYAALGALGGVFAAMRQGVN